MIPQTRSREYREGCIWRRRTYRCTECNRKFQVDTLNPLPKHDRACPDCKSSTYVYTFLSPRGKKYYVRAPDAELATLRAWRISLRLTFKGGTQKCGNQ